MAGHGGDIIAELSTDHREVEQLFAELETQLGSSGGIPADPDRTRTLTDQVIMELVKHSVAEEMYLYPTVRERLPGGEELAEREVSEQAEAERTMNALDGMSADNIQFAGGVRTLMQQIQAHVAGEENDLFPALRAALSADELNELGDKIRSGKQLAPTRPHPLAPDHPPLNKLLGPGAALVDRIRDAITGRGKG